MGAAWLRPMMRSTVATVLMFVVTDDSRRRWRTDSRRPEDYLCYDLPILAPADGEVVFTRDDIRDAPGCQ